MIQSFAKKDYDSIPTLDAWSKLNGREKKIIDEILSDFPIGYMDFSFPSEISADSDSYATVRISPLIDHIKSKSKNLPKIRIGDIMKVTLKGLDGNVEIQNLLDEEQPVSHENESSWKWRIKPSDSGEETFLLSLSIRIYFDNKEFYYMVHQEEKKIKINYPKSEKFSRFWLNNWQWIFGTLVLPVSALGYAFLMRRKNDKNSRKIGFRCHSDT